MDTDARGQQIKLRRIQHEINSMRVSIEKFEIDILENEATNDRVRESILATKERIAVKEAEFAKASSKQGE